MRNTLILTLSLAAALALVAVAQPPAPGDSKTSASTETLPAKAAAKESWKKIDADQAYKSNCMRCHTAPRKLSEREMVTVMRHMRVRANLTEEETEAILRYLTR